MSNKNFIAICTIFAWLVLSFLVAFAGVLLTGAIPILGLGFILAMFGVIIHPVLIGLDLNPEWWKFGIPAGLLLSALSAFLGTLNGDVYSPHFIIFFFLFYFTFSSLIYLFIQQVIIVRIINE